MRHQIKVLIIALFSISVSCSEKDVGGLIAGPDEIERYLHVPSPGWEDQILYFIVTDRFMDGDSTNNDQGTGEYRRGDGGYWNGGDLKGITQKIDYIKELGVTGVWITPPVANQWRNPQKTGTGNHGYWASSFVEVDKHLGTLDDYRQLSATLHKNGMYLIQDVVVNHLGDFYTYTGPYNQDDVTENFKVHDVPQPTQYPFNHNNALDPNDREMAIFHFAPNFYDHSDTILKTQYQFADLDDLNTANPIVRDVLRSSYNFWIKEVGVDGYRFDTPHMVEHDFWNDFLHSTDPENLGIYNFARSLGKNEFITPGEVAIFPMHYDHQGTVEAAKYLGTAQRPEMNSILNFPLSTSINRVFVEQKPTNTLTFRLNSVKRAFDRPEVLFNFIDNHDGSRFLSRTDKQSFRQALMFIMTIPGVPVIYYGTEQELLGMRQAMFKGGVGSPDKDQFNKENESFRFVQKLVQLRKDNEIFRRGKLNILRDDPSGPGVFIYELNHQEKSAMVMINTSSRAKIIDVLPTKFRKGNILSPYYRLQDGENRCSIDENGKLSMILRPKDGFILMDVEAPSPVHSEGNISIDPMIGETMTKESITITGKSSLVEKVLVSLDGDLERTVKAEPKDDGSWVADLSLKSLVNGKHRIVAFYEDLNSNIISDFFAFELELPIIKVASYEDQRGDDNGPAGTYSYPLHPSFSQQMDIEKVEAFRTGNNLQLDITMAEITRVWLPPNGYDHVLFNLFMDLTDGGASVLPFQNMDAPDNFKWDLWFSLGGFSNRSFISDGADQENPGLRHGYTPIISVDLNENKISLFFSSEALNYPEKLEGVKIYINTWEGGPTSPRQLRPEAETWLFGGGDDNDPKFMDDTEVITIK